MTILAMDTVYAIDELTRFIEDANLKIALIKSIDWGKPVDEETWHLLCATPMRGYQAMELLASSIFPEAEDFASHPNSISFQLHGFPCELPTTNRHIIKVDLSQLRPNRHPKDTLEASDSVQNMKKYFALLDSGNASWYDLARLRIMRPYRKWVLFLLWFGKYKWKNPHRADWELVFKTQEAEYQRRVEIWEQDKKRKLKEIKRFKSEVLPILQRFSSKIHDAHSDKPAEDLLKEWEE